MSHTTHPIQEDDLHAYIDGQLDDARIIEVEAYLAVNPADAERVHAYRKQNEMMRKMFDPVAMEPVPAEIKGEFKRRSDSPRKAATPILRYAAVVAWLVMGGVIGWILHGTEPTEPVRIATFAQQAAIAHVVYTPEVLHPVEVGADQEAHLVKWLSKRLGADIKAPSLVSVGYQLLGGRLLPGDGGPAAQFMYNNESGKRLTLYVRTKVKDNEVTEFRFEQEGKVGVFSWKNGPVGYALSGELAKPELLTVANAVYHQIQP